MTASVLKHAFFFQRVQLYNAYATRAMCKAGFEVLDVYPLSASFPNGTDSSHDPFDSVQYKAACSNPPRKSSWNISARGTTKRVMPVLRHSLSTWPSTRCVSGSRNELREAHLMRVINLLKIL